MCVTLVNELREGQPTGRHRLAVGLRDGQEFLLKASCVITVLKGAVEVWGATLRAAPNRDHCVQLAPGHPAPNIKAQVLPNDSSDPCLHCGGFCEESLLLCDLSKDYQIFCVIAINDEDVTNPQPLLISDTWRPISDELWARPCRHVMVAGATGTGKSSFCQWLINDWITRKGSPVALMDIDPGQPMYGVPGCVSLRVVIRPILSNSAAMRSAAQAYGESGLTLNGTVLMASHFVGSASPDGCFEAILKSLHEFNDQYQRLSTLTELGDSIPLILNTCGWVTGTGWQLLDAAAAIINCSDLVMLRSPEESEPTREWHRLKNSRHPFQPTLAQLGVPNTLPFFDPRRGHSVILRELASCVTETETKAGPRSTYRAERIASHLLPDGNGRRRFPREALTSEISFNRHLLSAAKPFPLDRFVFVTKQSDLSRANIDVIFKGSLVALRRSQGSKLFLCMAIITAIDWSFDELLLLVPPNIELSREQHAIEIVSGNKLKFDGFFNIVKKWASQQIPDILEKALASVIKLKKKKRHVHKQRKARKLEGRKSVMHRIRLTMKPRIKG